MTVYAKQPREHFDWVLLGIFVALAVLGIMNLYSATYGGASPLYATQIWWFVISFAVASAIAAVDYRLLERFAGPLYLGGLVLLALTLALGEEVKGARRWLDLGVGYLQPSELIKVALVVAIAKFAEERTKGGELGLADLARIGLLTLPACGLIMLQPDLGHAIMLGMIAATMVLFAGVQSSALFVTLAFLLPLPPLLWVAGAIRPYQLQRLASFLGAADPASIRALFQILAGVLGAGLAVAAAVRLRGRGRMRRATAFVAAAVALFVAGRGAIDLFEASDPIPIAEAEARGRLDSYQADQSKIAIGAGRLTGKGFMNATQTRFGYMPEHRTDFIFSHWAEEHGFVGAAGVLLVFLFLIVWAMRIATRSRDRFGAFLAVGIATICFWDVAVNVGMVTGLLPIVGVTLPLFSYGGSSVLSMFICGGLLMNISMRRRAAPSGLGAA